jgi:hypothetical protein
MSNLNKLLEKLAGAPNQPTVEVDDDGRSVTDPVYVEKLAAAVDYLVDTEFDEAPPDHAEVPQEKKAEHEEGSKEEVKLESSKESKSEKSKKVKRALLKKLKAPPEEASEDAEGEETEKASRP